MFSGELRPRKRFLLDRLVQGAEEQGENEEEGRDGYKIDLKWAISFIFLIICVYQRWITDNFTWLMLAILKTHFKNTFWKRDFDEKHILFRLKGISHVKIRHDLIRTQFINMVFSKYGISVHRCLVQSKHAYFSKYALFDTFHRFWQSTRNAFSTK